jgi:hypothetical protein
MVVHLSGFRRSTRRRKVKRKQPPAPTRSDSQNDGDMIPLPPPAVKKTKRTLFEASSSSKQVIETAYYPLNELHEMDGCEQPRGAFS